MTSPRCFTALLVPLVGIPLVGAARAGAAPSGACAELAESSIFESYNRLHADPGQALDYEDPEVADLARRAAAEIRAGAQSVQSSLGGDESHDADAALRKWAAQADKLAELLERHARREELDKQAQAVVHARDQADTGCGL